MVGLFEVIIIWAIIRYIIKKKKSGQNPGGGQTPNITMNNASTGDGRNNGRIPYGRSPINGRWGQNLSYPNGQAAAPGAPGGRKVNQQRQAAPVSAKTAAKTPETVREEESTTAYLAKKAEEDAREHAREKWEEEKRLRDAKGGLSVAGRHLDGDPIPQGSRCVICGYCAAENLIPMIPKSRYSCYFCREPLG